ncbi:MAG: hypothetical protein GY718_07125 [Lentisphaerae bacterium]|nr:hypothetical protein [Lentisphaerota bacterium]
MRLSSSKRNKKWRRRKAKKLLTKRNEGLVAFSYKIIPLTKAERKSMYKWEMQNLGLFNKKVTVRARKAAIKELDNRLDFKS